MFKRRKEKLLFHRSEGASEHLPCRFNTGVFPTVFTFVRIGFENTVFFALFQVNVILALIREVKEVLKSIQYGVFVPEGEWGSVFVLAFPGGVRFCSGKG